MEEDTKFANNKVGLKVFLIIVLEIIISIPLFIVASIIFGRLAEDNFILGIITSAILVFVSLHFALLILKKRFIPVDAKNVSKWLAIIFMGIYIAYFIFFREIDLLVTGVIYTIINYFYTKLFIENKFKNINN